MDGDQTLRAISLDPSLEQEIADSVNHTQEGEYLAMDPDRAQALVGSLAGEVEQATGLGTPPGADLFQPHPPPRAAADRAVAAAAAGRVLQRDPARRPG